MTTSILFYSIFSIILGFRSYYISNPRHSLPAGAMQFALGRTMPWLSRHSLLVLLLPLLLLPLLLPPLLLLPLPVLLVLPPLEDPLEVEHNVLDTVEVQSLPCLLPGGTDKTV